MRNQGVDLGFRGTPGRGARMVEEAAHTMAMELQQREALAEFVMEFTRETAALGVERFLQRLRLGRRGIIVGTCYRMGVLPSGKDLHGLSFL
jgi:hypothetical protein